MAVEHVPFVTEPDRLWVLVEALLAVLVVTVAYLGAKLRGGWSRPHRPWR